MAIYENNKNMVYCASENCCTSLYATSRTPATWFYVGCSVSSLCVVGVMHHRYYGAISNRVNDSGLLF